MTSFDFFISYSYADRAWAEWLGVELEKHGFRVVLDGWQIAPGAAFAGKIEELISDSGTFVALVSHKYLDSRHTQAEWVSVLLNGPISGPRLLPVRVSDVELPPLLRRLTPVDLFGLSEGEARDRISLIASGRTRPLSPPLFPGDAQFLHGPRGEVGSQEPLRYEQATPKRIFVSYSHRDVKWLNIIKPFLRPLERDGSIDLWSDTRINAGHHWRQEIEDALSRADIALLLVSSDFLASDFIASEELPKILEQATEGRTMVYSIIVRPSSFERSPLEPFQTLNPPATPLSAMKVHQRETLLVEMVNSLADSLGE